MFTFFMLMLISGGCFYHAYRQKRNLDKKLKEMQERIDERNAQPCDCEGGYCDTHDSCRDENFCEDDEFDEDFDDCEEEDGYHHDDYDDYDDNYSDDSHESYGDDYSDDDHHYDDVESDERRDELMEWSEE
jgi:hypothetical protein